MQGKRAGRTWQQGPCVDARLSARVTHHSPPRQPPAIHTHAVPYTKLRALRARASPCAHVPDVWHRHLGLLRHMHQLTAEAHGGGRPRGARNSSQVATQRRRQQLLLAHCACACTGTGTGTHDDCRLFHRHRTHKHGGHGGRHGGGGAGRVRPRPHSRPYPGHLHPQCRTHPNCVQAVHPHVHCAPFNDKRPNPHQPRGHTLPTHHAPHAHAHANPYLYLGQPTGKPPDS
jgi:hypothetical protein